MSQPDQNWVQVPTVIPSGGTEGQRLSKASDNDYDVEWQDPDVTPGPAGPPGPPGGSTSIYTFNYNPGVEPVPSGQFRLDVSGATLQSQATKMWMSHITATGTDITHLIDEIPLNTKIGIQDEDDSTRYQVYFTTALPVDKGTYTEINVVWDHGGAEVPQQRMIAAVTFQGEPGPPGPGVPPFGLAGSILAKFSDESYDTYWAESELLGGGGGSSTQVFDQQTDPGAAAVEGDYWIYDAPGEPSPGPVGPQGEPGSKIYIGAGDPSVVPPANWTPNGTAARAGDLYIDSSTNDMYILE